MSRQLFPQFLKPTNILFLYFLHLFVLHNFQQLYTYLRIIALPFNSTIHDQVSCGGVWLLYPAPKFLEVRIAFSLSRGAKSTTAEKAKPCDLRGQRNITIHKIYADHIYTNT